MDLKGRITDKEKQEMLKTAAKDLNNRPHPFFAVVHEDSLVVSFCCNDTDASNRMKNFRYVVIVNNDGTFYGYDTNETMLKYTGIDRKAVFKQSRPHPKTFGKKKQGCSTYKLHKAVIKAFEDQGYEYEEPTVMWLAADGSVKSNLMAAGMGFLFLFISLSFICLIADMAEILLFISIFGITGMLLLTAGAGFIRIPIFSTAFCRIFIQNCAVMSFAAALIFSAVMML